jgi:hypothetical protein
VWFEKNKNSFNLKFKPYNISCTVQTRKDFIQTSEIHSELLFRHCSYYSDTRGVTSLPPNRNLVPRFGRSSGCYSDTLGVSQPSPVIEISSRDSEGAAALTDTVNNYTIPHYGKMKSRWQKWRKSSLSQVASPSEWLLHCILKNLIVLHLVTRSI